MANTRKGTLSVPLGDDLLIRVNKVAESLHLSAAQFVRQVLEEKTRRHQKEVAEILKRQAKIQKEYDGGT